MYEIIDKNSKSYFDKITSFFSKIISKNPENWQTEVSKYNNTSYDEIVKKEIANERDNIKDDINPD